MSTDLPDLARMGASLASRPYARRGISMSNETIRVILVDDHAMVREGLRLLLRNAPDIAVVGEAQGGRPAIDLAQRVLSDIVVLDLDMPDGDGVTALRELTASLPQIRVLILTVHAEHERLLPLLEAGARGYLTKEAASSELVEAIRVVAAGEIYVRPAAARLLAAAVVPERDRKNGSGPPGNAQRPRADRPEAGGSKATAAEIARQLGISTKTIDAYKRRVQEKLGLQHRTDYVKFAIEAGVLGV